ncbi:TGS domain-containing protein, partial [Candidatus Sumerlaeota bacterium]|nr:TGS domain-containing protein [Candidatus Sumerlaeota bacterium]
MLDESARIAHGSGSDRGRGRLFPVVGLGKGKLSLAKDPLEIHRHNLNELSAEGVPVLENPLGNRGAGIGEVTLDHLAHKIEFFERGIVVFTPKGDMIELPEGATGIDFAFALHTDIGLHLDKLTANDKIIPLSQELSDGD